ncbi:UNVERIFIED_CONTAM: hypothetical protein K2H54_051018 [Gekko kuhli]
MGRSGNPKASKTAAKPQQLMQFLVRESTTQHLPEACNRDSKMADDPICEDDGTPLSKSDFLTTIQQLKTSLADQIRTDIVAAIKPLSEELKAITTTLSEVAQAAESALETAIMAQDKIQHLQKAEDWAKLKIMSLENKLRENNLKFRNIPEDSEGTTELKVFLATWLSQSLQLEEDVAPFIDRAYRVGPTMRKNEKYPRDIIAAFPDHCTREAIMGWSISVRGFTSNALADFQDRGADWNNFIPSLGKGGINLAATSQELIF